jgi:dTDP-3-amino-3,4,6-trideoxy-alpha-D-glucose transaminase
MPFPEDILMNDFRRQWADTREQALSAFTRVAESGWYILGREVRNFEQALAALWGLRVCVGVASGMDAIEISLRALGCKAGDHVLTTPLSAFATTLAIVKIGARPVFVDTDRYGLLDLDLCEELLIRRPEIRFMVPVHLYGNALNLSRLSSLRAQFNLSIVEDCAQSILATHDGVLAGSAGHAAATSFYPTKNLGAMGDAGAILTNDEHLARSASALRDYGQTGKYRHEEIGYNSRLDELQAAILRDSGLCKLSSWTARRRAIAARYLAGIDHPEIQPIGNAPGSNSCFHLFPVMVPPARKQCFRNHLTRHKISSGEHYPFLIPEQSAMAHTPHEVIGDCPIARRIAAGELTLPVHPYLTDEEVERLINVCNEWHPGAVRESPGT